MHVHFIVHELFEAPGAFETWAASRRHTVTYSRLYLGESLPRTIADVDLLVVLGGPQRPDSSREQCLRFDAAAERRLIQQCVSTNKAVVGVCLGSQLLGEALGAPYEHSPETEIGNFPIWLTEAGKANDKFSHISDTVTVGHWHNDMPGLTPDAKVIAYSRGCPRQIVEFSEFMYGFQCHLEFNAEVIEFLIEASQSELSDRQEHNFVQQAAALREYDYTGMNNILFAFLDKLVAAYKAKTQEQTAHKAPGMLFTTNRDNSTSS